MRLESQEHGLLYAALSKAHAEFPTIRVNRKAFKNEYADLYAVLKPIYPILEKYELAVVPITGILDGVPVIGARLGHSSGQFITNVLPFTPDECKNPNDQRSHKFAGGMTYLHRNFIKNILGVLISEDPEDNDMQGPAVHDEPRYYPKQADDVYISRDQEDVLRNLIGNDEELAMQVLKHYEIKLLKDLFRKDFVSAEKNIRTVVDKKKMIPQK